MKKSILLRITLILLLGLWATVIFVMSSQPATESSQTSGKIVLKIVDIIYRDFDNFPSQQQQNILHIITLLVRKTAHFLEYFILGLLSSGVAATYRSKRQYLNFIGSILFGVIYAISDEVHQHFVPGRACRFGDICIDSAGVICAVVLVALLANIIKRQKTGDSNAKKEVN